MIKTPQVFTLQQHRILQLNQPHSATAGEGPSSSKGLLPTFAILLKRKTSLAALVQATRRAPNG